MPDPTPHSEPALHPDAPSSDAPPPAAPPSDAPPPDASPPAAGGSADAPPSKPVKGSLWVPLRRPLFRALWIANMASFVGTWVHDVAAAWLMTSLAPTPLMVAAVQAATTLPLFFLVLPAGALADVADRRRVLLVAQSWMLLVAATLSTLSFLDLVTPVVLLLLTSLMAVGMSLTAPAWQAILPEVVSRQELPEAAALGSLSVNVARAVGPALGGLIVAAAGPGAAFLLNSLSFLGILAVIGRWRRETEPSDLPAERFLGALRTGIRYVRHAPRLRAVLVRAVAFTLSGSAVWALLPLLARGELGLSAAGYGTLLGVFGAGAVTSATQLPRLRRRFTADTLALLATLLYAAALTGLSLAPGAGWALAAMLPAGMGWLLLLSSFQVAAQTVLPAWVRARALAAYLLVFFGSLAVGSLTWGTVASFLGLRAALALAAVGAAASVLLRWRFPLRGGEDLDLSPSRHWPTPGVEIDVDTDQGPVLVTVEYRVDPADLDAFRRAMEQVGRARQRDGAYFWDLFGDTAEPGRFLEVFLSDSWLEHLRQHERVTEDDRFLESQARRFVTAGRPVRVQHLVSVRKPRRRE